MELLQLLLLIILNLLKNDHMKIAIVHDYLNQYGGAEKVVEIFNELFPDAPIFTSIYDERKFPEHYEKMDIRTSFMQKFPFLDRHFKKYLLFYPKAIESIDLKGFDLILSSSSAFAKGAIKDKNACHICYCHAPMRFVWEYERYIEKENFGSITKSLLPLAIRQLKKWDLKTIDRVDHYIANAEYTKNKIKRYYNKEAVVINPPINVKEFIVSNKVDDYFLIVSRLNAYKNIDLVVNTFNVLGLKLKIVGLGPYKETLMDMAKTSNIKFLGRLDNEELKEAYSRCRAFIFPGKEDFGITPVEAQASGRPVIAFGEGGALETVIEGKTGLFFKENSEDSLMDAVNKFIKIEDRFDSREIVKNALQFDKSVFKDKILAFINTKYKEYFKAK